MGGNNYFQALKQYSTKEYKFTQGKSLARLDPTKSANADAANAMQISEKEFEGVKRGICAVLAADWLREKLAAEKLLFSGLSQGPGIHAGQNMDTVVRNVPKMLSYKECPSAAEALNQHGLTPTNREVGNPMVNERVQTVERSRSRDGSMHSRNAFVSRPKFAESLAKACTTAFLKEGRGVYISFKVKGKREGGHAVAAYRSRGNTLYFFDCNCGVYNVTNPAGFFTAYGACYGNLGFSCAPESFTYVDR
jgi:hypothetical protein